MYLCKHKTLTQCWAYIGPALSQNLVIGWIIHVICTSNPIVVGGIKQEQREFSKREIKTNFVFQGSGTFSVRKVMVWTVRVMPWMLRGGGGWLIDEDTHPDVKNTPITARHPMLL